MSGTPGKQRADGRASEARERLLQATLRCAKRDGGSSVSLQSIAVAAGVSKALVLYHFHDKETLLATTVGWLNDRLVTRERRALEQSTASSVLEDYWRWLDDELQLGEFRVLLEFAQERGSVTRLAVGSSARERQVMAEATVLRVFALLDLVPRLPAPMLASCELAFREGIALWSAQRPSENARIAFDVFWLSLLSLAR